MRKEAVCAAVAAVLLFAASAGAAPSTPAPALPPEIVALEKSLHPITGDVPIPGANATMRLGDDYYFLPAAEARRILVEAWGNPPQAAEDVLGMVFPKGQSFIDNGWAAVVTFEATGYVSDENAREEDYDAVMTAMREGAEAANEERKANGFSAVHLVGWAQPPAYDPAAHSLIWARELNFEGEQVHSLNYDVRLLGRRGVLSLNMVAAMPQLAEVRTAAASFARTASFDPGARYADFNAATDQKAEYGLAGLVAAGAGVAAAKKLGLLGIILAFGKKFFVLILIALAAAGRWAVSLIGRGKDRLDEEPAVEETTSGPVA